MIHLVFQTRRSASLALACAVLVGCRAGPVPAPPGEASLDGAVPVHAGDVYPLRLADWHYEVLEPPGPGPLIVQRRPTERFDAAWSNADGDDRIQFWQLDEQGNLVMTAVIDEPEEAITIFRPPLIVAPAVLEVGRDLRQEVQMQVVSLRNPRRVRESGTAVQTITHRGRRQVDGPGGPHEASELHVEFQADLRMADVHNHTLLLVVPGLGVTREERDEQVAVLGVLPSVSRRVLMLTSLEEAPAPAPPQTRQ